MRLRYSPRTYFFRVWCTYITVPYKEKEEAKAKGAKWDTEQKSWYVPKGVDLNLFKKWKTHEPYKTVSVEEMKSRLGLNNKGNTNSKMIYPLEKKNTHIIAKLI